MDFDSNEFNHFLRGSLKHGWLQKRSKGLTSVIPRKRYFVLCDECLYWFRQEKMRFVQKGELDIMDAVLVTVSADAMTLHKKSTGKDYILTGENILEWAQTLKAVLEPLVRDLHDRLTISSKPEEGKIMLTELCGESCDEGCGMSRKSTGRSTQASSKKSMSSIVGGSSCPEVPAVCSESELDSLSFDEENFGLPILTQETLKSHDSSFEPFTLTFRHAAAEDDIDDDKLNVGEAIHYFEHLEERKPSKRRRRLRKKRLFSRFGPETRDRLGANSGVGGEECPEPEVGTEKVIRCFSDLATSLANMLDELDDATGNLESQTLDNLYLWERGNSLLPKEERMQKKPLNLVSTESEPSFLRIPLPGTARSDDSFRSSNGSFYRYSRGSSYRGFRGGSYVPGFARFVGPQMSLVSVDSEESLTAASFPESEMEFDEDNPYSEVESYIHSRLVKNESVSMIDLTKEFRGKRVPEDGFRKIFEIVRDRVQTDKRISYRQSSTIKSELRLVNNNNLQPTPNDLRIRHSTVYDDYEENEESCLFE